MHGLEPGFISAPCDFVPKTFHLIKGYPLIIEVFFFVLENEFCEPEGSPIGFSLFLEGLDMNLF